MYVFISLYNKIEMIVYRKSAVHFQMVLFLNSDSQVDKMI